MRRKENEAIRRRKKLVEEYCQREFGDEENLETSFADLRNVDLAYTTSEDEEIPIQVKVDLIDMNLKTYIGKEEKLIKTEPVDEDFLSTMRFDDLVSEVEIPEEDSKNSEDIPAKEKLTIIARLIVNCCSHEEINWLCVALLDANVKCEARNIREQKGEKRHE